MPFCTNCGKQVNEGDKFCSECGFNLSPERKAVYAEPEDNSGIKILNGADPVFRVKCESCACEFEYKLANLGFRAWYPNGFVYCPKCKKPIRHHVENEVK